MNSTGKQLLNALGEFLIPRGRHPQAEEALRQAVARCQAAERPDAGLVVATLKMGIACHLDGFIDEAGSWYSQAMRIMDCLDQCRLPYANVGQHLETASTLFIRHGDYSMAEAALNRAVSITQTALGNTHPRVIALHHRRALVARRLARMHHDAKSSGQIQDNRGDICDGV